MTYRVGQIVQFVHDSKQLPSYYKLSFYPEVGMTGVVEYIEVKLSGVVRGYTVKFPLLEDPDFYCYPEELTPAYSNVQEEDFL